MIRASERLYRCGGRTLLFRLYSAWSSVYLSVHQSQALLPGFNVLCLSRAVGYRGCDLC